MRTALLEFFLTENSLYTYVVRPVWPERGISDTEPPVVQTALDPETVRAAVHCIRSFIPMAITPGHTDQPEVYEPALAPFFDLSERIFTPELMALIEPFEALYLVPFGDLHYLPLHALRPGGRYLIDQFKIAYLPSASVLQFIGKRQSQNGLPKTLLAAGVDYTGSKPYFRHEAEDIAALACLNTWEKTVLLEPEATLSQFLESAAGKTVIHLSAHGYYAEEDPLLSGALLFGAPRRAAPATTPDQRYALTAKTIFQQLRLDADLITLSACVTGQSENRPGDELIGLTRSLMFAGARSIIAALFPTYKDVTGQRIPGREAARFAHFYDLWLGAGLNKATAFQQYIQAVKLLYPAPHQWFSFVLIGNMY
ncbi:MAG: CHAT domain-containing protein [Lewinellaceae bacterium]|nr:CHAT domain-containing protein [Lewinellaceae bacterium]